MKIIDCEQGSIEWIEARLGKPTASNFDKILTPANMQVSKSREAYLHDLCEERFEVNHDFYKSRYMVRGSELEEEARNYYTAFITTQGIQQVGFITDDSGRYGCSPDALVGNITRSGRDGGFEVKCPKLITHRKYRNDKKIPTEYRLQVLGGLLVTGRKWWDFMSYFPGTKPYVFRVYAEDHKDDINTLRVAVELFCDDLDKLEEEERR